MEKYHGHTLDYWKSNAEEDYIKTPISVLKYITCLEEHIEQLTIPAVVGQSEQLKCHCTKSEKYYDPIGDLERCQKCEKAL